jgi:uncharacterized glyoxalase superfamily protein PhnB
MSVPYKPAAYSTVSPYLIVDGAEATISFLTQVFGATRLRLIPGGAGKVMHAEVRLDDSVIMLTDAMPPAWPAAPAHVHVYVPDVDATYEKAVAAGAVSVQAPVQRGDENKRGAVKDAGGTTWWMSTKVE